MARICKNYQYYLVAVLCRAPSLQRLYLVLVAVEYDKYKYTYRGPGGQSPGGHMKCYSYVVIQYTVLSTSVLQVLVLDYCLLLVHSYDYYLYRYK